ncbi:MAG TPA: threonine synthase [Thermoplasmata archaeon]
MRPTSLECTSCRKHHGVRLANLCDCGAPLFARYELSKVRKEDLEARKDLWRYGPLLPLESDRDRSRGEGGTPLYRLSRLGSGGRVARLKVGALYVKDEGLNPTGTFKARGMAVAVPMAQSLGAESVVAPTAGNAGAALAMYASTYGLAATILMTQDAPAEAKRIAVAFGAKVLLVRGDISRAGRIAADFAEATGAFNLATLREPYRVEGKKTMLLEIWEALGGMPDWILFPTGGGTGVCGIWKGLQELRELGWYKGPWPRIGVVQAEGCAPLVEAWTKGREAADPWPRPKTSAAGLRVPATLADRIVLRAVRETKGAAVAVSDAAMAIASANLAALEGISAGLEGAATLAGLRRLYDEGTITSEERVVLVNTGSARKTPDVRTSRIPLAGTVKEAQELLDITPRAS